MTRTDIYSTVTASIIADLEAGIAPWARPWSNVAVGASGLPCSAKTGRAYSGINILLLWGAAISGGFTSSKWLTFKQARDLGGSVRKGSKGTAIVYADRFIPASEKARADRTGDDARSIAFLKSFYVFSLDQIDGLDHLRSADQPMPARHLHAEAERIIAAAGVEIRTGGDRAFYAPAQDFIQIPPQPAFHDQINYYRTALHELSHATGHETRLNRKLLNAFGSKDMPAKNW